MNIRSKILIVDDERANLTVLVNFLRVDYEIIVARNGREALDLLKPNRLPDLILLDIVMPGLDGYEVCQKVKSQTTTKHIPVIFITSKNNQEDETQGFELGAVDYIAKPFSPLVVMARIKTHLGLRRAQKELAHKNKELQQMLSMRETMESIARHDLKGPLNGILGVPQILINNENLTKYQKEMIRLIEVSGFRMLEMIDRSLDLLKMETGNYQFKPNLVELIRVTQRVLHELGHFIQGDGVSSQILLNDCPVQKRDEFIIKGDELLFHSLLSNLVKNALEAAPAQTKVTIVLHDVPVRGFSIHNFGAVPPHIRDRFFEKYITFGKENGTGLGTYSAKLIVETLGGTITMVSSEKAGTTITVTMCHDPVYTKSG